VELLLKIMFSTFAISLGVFSIYKLKPITILTANDQDIMLTGPYSWRLLKVKDQPWDFFGRNDAKVETPVLWPPHVKS